jgi:3-hydroxybutyryl-CoA dehydratase
VTLKDIKVGDEIPTDINRLITQEMIDRWGEVSGDFNPIHVSPDFAKTTIFGSTISHGTLTITYILEMLTRWLGEGWLVGGQLEGVKFISPVRPGDIVIPRGKIVNKWIENDENLVECNVWLETQRGTRAIIGKAFGRII